MSKEESLEDQGVGLAGGPGVKTLFPLQGSVGSVSGWGTKVPHAWSKNKIKIRESSGSDGKASAYNVGDPGSIPGSGSSPGEGNGN